MSQASSSRVSRELQGHVLLLGLDRPAKRNAFDLDLLNELSLAYGEFDRNAEARVAVVFAHGDHFTAGLDLANVSGVMAVAGSHPWEAVIPGACSAARA
ncbi:enoyl-CoA hydratase/carnithine racemase [Pseudomonas cedrina]|nr:enoyl-CoA hydratase/carnithine racemase [Pseudomonas cedrina]